MIITIQNKMIKVHRISCSASRSCLLELLIFESLRNMVFIFSLSNSASENKSQENDLKCKKTV